MRKNYAVWGLICLLVLPFAGFPQSECDGQRYYEPLFPTLTVTKDVTYGSNINLQNQTQSLEMDIYEPNGDTLSARPLIIMAHGGSFIGGSKDQADIKPWAEEYAKMGYVTASIEYRLGMRNFPLPGPDSIDAMEAVVRGVHDAKAAIRWWRKDAANGNNYRIDTNRIYFMGSSAGSFIGIHLAYLDSWTELPSSLDTIGKPDLSGGLQGNSGNPGYSSEVDALVNYSGAIGDTTWIQADEPPMVSLHGTSDDVVPYGTQVIVLVGFYQLLEVDGSGTIHQHLDNIGMENCLYTMNGAGHVPYVGNAAYADTTRNIVIPFLAKQACGQGSYSCNYIVGIEDVPALSLKVFPNPAEDRLKVDLPLWEGEGTAELDLIDIQGRKLRHLSSRAGQSITIEREGLPGGIYLLRLQAAGQTITHKVVFR